MIKRSRRHALPILRLTNIILLPPKYTLQHVPTRLRLFELTLKFINNIIHLLCLNATRYLKNDYPKFASKERRAAIIKSKIIIKLICI